MTLVKWNPNRSLLNLAEGLFDDFFGADRMLSRTDGVWYPAVDIKEDKDTYKVVMELPGLSKDDVQISLEDGVLIVKGEKKSESEEKEGDYHYYERRFGKFERMFRINSEIKQDQVEASFKDGILSIDLPKTETAKPKQIAINVK
jgi:HSP20 family protein